MNGGNDSFSATGNLAALIKVTVDGGTGNDTILGSNGNDMLLGGDGNDFIDGQQGNDVAFLGAGNDVFQWDPGDGSDTVEGQDGTDTHAVQRQQRRRDLRGVGERRARALHPQPRQHRDGPRTTSRPSTSTRSAAPTPSRSTTCPAPTSPRSTSTSPGGRRHAATAQADTVIVNAHPGQRHHRRRSAPGTSVSVVGLSAQVNVTGERRRERHPRHQRARRQRRDHGHDAAGRGDQADPRRRRRQRHDPRQPGRRHADRRRRQRLPVRRQRQRPGADGRRRRRVPVGSGRRQRHGRGPGRHRHAAVLRREHQREHRHRWPMAGACSSPATSPTSPWTSTTSRASISARSAAPTTSWSAT